jgi:ABC-type multidrug transport system ATPase subunit
VTRDSSQRRAADYAWSVAANQAILEVERLERSFDERKVVNELTVAVEPGERVALFGPNGSGKTTVLRCVAGTLTPSSGKVLIGGNPAGSMPARRTVGVSLAQDRSWYMRLSGHANLMFFARLRHGRERDARRDVAALVDELELQDIAAERVDRCSSGMVQQLALARALLGEPALLLLDEPTRSLDRDARARLWAALERRKHVAALVASHLDEDLERCGRRIDFPT